MKRLQRFRLTDAGVDPMWVGLVLALFYWILESVIHSFVLENEDFYHHLFRMDLHETWNRLLVVSLLLGFGFYSQYTLAVRRKTEKALEESEKKYRTLFKEASNPIFIFDEKGNMIDSNTAAKEFLEYHEDE